MSPEKPWLGIQVEGNIFLGFLLSSGRRRTRTREVLQFANLVLPGFSSLFVLGDQSAESLTVKGLEGWPFGIKEGRVLCSSAADKGSPKGGEVAAVEEEGSSPTSGKENQALRQSLAWG